MIAFDSTVVEVELAALGPLNRIGTGRRGPVHELRAGPENLVYQAYAPDVPVDADELTRLVRLLRELDDQTAGELLERAAWPVNVVIDGGVVDGGVVCGFVMPRAPADFTVDLTWKTGHSSVPGSVELLFNDESYLRERGLLIGDEFRLEFLRDAARTLALLHRSGLCAGDASWLFSRTHRPACLLVDCDGSRLDVDTAADDDGIAADGTAVDDRRQLGLLAVRLFAGDVDSRDPDVVPRRLRPLVIRALGDDPHERPTAGEWEEPVSAALRAQPGPRPPKPRTPRRTPNAGRVTTSPGTGTGPAAGRVRPKRRFWWGLVAWVAPFAIVIGLINADESAPSRSSSGVPVLPAPPPLTAYRPPAGLSAYLPPSLPPYVPPSLVVPRPSINIADICLRTIVLYAKGVAVNQQVTDVISKSCGGNRTVTITGISKGTNNTLRVSVRFADTAGACRRQAYTLAPEAGGFQIADLSDPVAATGCR